MNRLVTLTLATFATCCAHDRAFDVSASTQASSAAAEVADIVSGLPNWAATTDAVPEFYAPFDDSDVAAYEVAAIRLQAFREIPSCRDRCGGSSSIEACQCDAACAANGDCCSDLDYQC